LIQLDRIRWITKALKPGGRLAKAKGIEQFVLVSSIGASQLFHPLNLFWLILVWKKQAEEYLQKVLLPIPLCDLGVSRMKTTLSQL